MKLLYTLCGFAVVYFLYVQHEEISALHAKIDQAKQQAAAKPAKPVQEPLPATIPKEANFQQLWLVRGTVRDVTEDGLLIYCEPQPVPNPYYSRLPANAGAGDAAAMANASLIQERREYGEAMTLYKGKLFPVNEPRSKAGGIVLLRDHPDKDRMVLGQKIKVVAFPDGMTNSAPRRMIFTMNFIYQYAQGEPEIGTPRPDPTATPYPRPRGKGPVFGR